MPEFFRFPHTPHLAWLSGGAPRGDKVLSDTQVRAMLSQDVVVEEKVDGANVGISISEHGEILAQNRGRYLRPGDHPQYGPLWPWLATRTTSLRETLGQDLILFGEWCFALHSVRYDRLPDWFLAFDVYDRRARAFWSSERRNELLVPLAAQPVPELLRGRTSLTALIELVERSASRVSSTKLEGVYVRSEAHGLLQARAKIVRPEFVQQIEEHWSRRPLEPNALAQR